MRNDGDDAPPASDRARYSALWRLLAFAGFFIVSFPLGIFVLGLVQPEVDEAALLLQGVLVLVPSLGAGWILLRWMDGRAPGALGFAWTPSTPRELRLGFAIGGGSLAGVVLVLVVSGLIRYEAAPGGFADLVMALVVQFVMCAVAAAAEEALFRGYAFQVLVEWIDPVPGTLVTSLAFAGAHLANPGIHPFALLNIFLAGVLLSVAYLRTRSLWFATAVHLSWNWTMTSVLGLPVSGIDFLARPLYRAVPGEPAFITGGAFGPEGGLAATLAMAIALGLILHSSSLRPDPVMRRLGPLVDRRLGAGAARGLPDG